MGNSFPPPGCCSLAALPEPYQTAFRLGSAHHLPGQFLPAHTDWFIQIFLLPFMLMYGSPMLVLGPSLLLQAFRKPDSYWQFLAKVMQQTPLQIAVTGLLLFLIIGLMGYCTYQAWEMAQSSYRTWHASRLRKNREYGYGLVLLSHAMVGRLIDNLGRHNCLWLPRPAIAHIAWQEMREEGAKYTRWVYRTRICYVSGQGDKHWLTLRGDTVRADTGALVPMGDRDLYDTLVEWWQHPKAN